ncbi:sensor histidine kinase [Micrococcus luteus]|uniref:sensor histidine kinase n=1 Tax=Micrococcus luteus TaxID=1270 RepID=UPI0037AC2BEC
MRWRRLAVRTRLTLMLATVVVLALAVSGVTAYRFLRSGLHEQVDESLERSVEQVQLLARTGVVPETGEPVDEAEELIRLAMVRVGTLDNEGMLGLGEDRATLGASDAVELRLEQDPALVAWGLERVHSDSVVIDTVQTDTALYRAVVVPVGGGAPDDVGALLLAFDMDAEAERLDETFHGYLAVAALSTLISLLLGAPLLRRVFAPLEALRDTVAEVSEHDLGRRVTVVGEDDVAALSHGFNAMLDRLEASFASQRRLLDDVGHEIRTPLTIVQGHLEVMDPDDPADVRDSTRLAQDELDRMGRLVADLVTLASSERPDFLRPTPADVGELTRAVADQARGLGERDWHLEAAAEGIAVLDSQRLTQAWLQLASNAVRYSGPGSSVGVGSEIVGGRLRMWVRDEGVGVRPEDRAVIFRRFGRGAHGRRADGSGLGLAIVASIVEGHGGRVHLDSIPGTGSMFTMEIPLRPAAALEHGPTEREGVRP